MANLPDGARQSFEGKQSAHGWVSVLSSKSSRETLDDRYTDEKYVIQEEPTTVILPVDSSAYSEYCLQFYIRFIHKIGNKVCVLYVSEEYVKMKSEDEDDDDLGKKGISSCCKKSKAMVVRSVGASPGILKELEHQDKLKCHAFKRKIKKWFRTNGVLFEFHRLVGEDTAKTIVQFTKQKQGTMVVMGARRLSGFKSTFMTSVSKKVVALSDVPVLVVKDPVQKRSSQTTIN